MIKGNGASYQHRPFYISDMEVKEQISLYYKEGGSDKVYQALLREGTEGCTVEFAYGRRGNALTGGSKTPEPVPYDKAKKIYDKLVHEKTCKGYTPEEGSKPFTGNSSSEERDTGVRPQLLNEIEEDELQKYLNSDSWCAEEKYDGRRRLIIKTGDKVEGTNRKGLTIALSEDIIKVVEKMHPTRDYILDGEALGDSIMIFDYLDPKLTYKERRIVLQNDFKFKGDIIKIAPIAWTKSDKRALLKRLQKDNAEGIVFKRIDSMYIPGRPSSGGDQLKFKFCATASCVVSTINKTKRSVSLQVLADEESFINIGNVTVYPNQDIPTPGSIVEVRYLYYFPGGSLFQPVLLGERDDININECTLSQLKMKREEITD